MTVQYIHKVASGTALMSFYLLKRWKGSVWKVVWRDLVVYLVVYYTLSLVYRFGLGVEGRRQFESLVLHCARYQSMLPVSFVLGFYVSLVVSRWWETFRSFPWPDNTAILLATHLPGQGIEVLERRAVLRYVVLCFTLTLVTISPVVKAEWPNLENMVAKGFLTKEELQLLNKHQAASGQHVAWVPMLWACRIVHRARREGRITSDLGQKSLVDEMLGLRSRCQRLLGFNNHNIPLVYAQVVTVAVYSFFVFSVIGGQFLDITQGYASHTIDLYVPLFGLLQLVFYLGWLKVAEALLNPFGDDDHDFDFVSLIDKHRRMVEMLGEAAANDLPALSPLPEEKTPTLPDPHTDPHPGDAANSAKPPVAPPPFLASSGSRTLQETTPLIP
ncbi:Bestrophin-3 [Chionoecetes opilio]|uniref:Bestrophin homolog n=1 Tax=Chionoecetes opilio TaxID=41210 RepID=A0A8J4YC72_CHIOP|nr:Bestrophin-3 [Chionoecetes opilio]